MTSKQLMKATIVSFLIIFISTTSLIGFAYGGSYAYDTVFSPSTLLEKNTRVANISIGENTIQEAVNLLTEETEGWKETKEVSFLYKDNIVSKTAASLFFFDIDGSIEYAKTNQIAPLFVSINDGSVDEMLTELSIDHLVEKVDRELLNNDLQAYARAMKQEDLQLNIHDYILEANEEEIAAVSEVYITNFTNSNNLQQLANALNGTTIEPREISSYFSMLEAVGALKSSYEMSVIATGLYTALLNTNFEIIERHISQSLPEYSELGYEAFVSHPNQDLRFFNPNYIPYTIEVKPQSDYLYVAIVGYPFEKGYTVEKKEEQTFEPKTVLQFSAFVAEGEREIKNPGQVGFAVNVFRNIYLNNSFLETKLISEDFYRPIHRIEVRSLINPNSPLTENNGIPNPTELDENYYSPPRNNEGEGQNGTGNQGELPDGKEEDIDFEYDETDPIKGY